MDRLIVGICGTGRMGSAIAERLLEAGATVHVWNRDAAKTEPLAARGAVVGATPGDVARACGTVITILFDGAAVDAVYRGPDGLLAGAGPDTLFIEMSTTGHELSQGLDADVRAAGAAMIECPVGGTVGPARAGQLLGLVGGEPADVERARPVLDLLCRRVEHAGPVGAGARLKLAVNLPLLVYWAALGEALALVADLDIPPERLVDLMADTSGAAAVLKRRVPELADLLADATQPATSFGVHGAAKDLGLMVEAAESDEGRSPVAAAAWQTFREASERGFADADALAIAGLGYLRRRGTGG